MSRRSSTGSSTHLLHLDCFSGIAGNMFLAALIEVGLKRKDLEADLAGLGLEYSLRISRVRRGALSARYLDVRVPKPKGHKKGHSHGRTYAEIRRLLRAARLDPSVRTRALEIFEALGRAEARVHGLPLERVHFHEVGAVDAIVDITGAAIGVARLGITEITASPVALGHGSVETQHGRLPLPAPATLELLCCLNRGAWGESGNGKEVVPPDIRTRRVKLVGNPDVDLRSRELVPVRHHPNYLSLNAVQFNDPTDDRGIGAVTTHPEAMTQ